MAENQNPKINNEVADKVMAEINSGQVKLRSKYIFLMEKIGIRSIVIFLVLLAVLLFNLVFYYLKESDNLDYLSFGSRGILAFLESLPYLLVICLAACLLLAGLIIKLSYVLYSKPFGQLISVLVVFAALVGGVLIYSGLSEKIENEAFSGHATGKLFRPLLGPGLDDRQWGVVGRISEVGNGYITLQTPNSTRKLDLTHLDQPLRIDLTVGMFVIAIGERNGEVFEAQDLRVLDNNNHRMIRRGVHRRFNIIIPPPGPMPMMRLN